MENSPASSRRLLRCDKISYGRAGRTSHCLVRWRIMEFRALIYPSPSSAEYNETGTTAYFHPFDAQTAPESSRLILHRQFETSRVGAVTLVGSKLVVAGSGGGVSVFDLEDGRHYDNSLSEFVRPSHQEHFFWPPLTIRIFSSEVLHIGITHSNRRLFDSCPHQLSGYISYRDFLLLTYALRHESPYYYRFSHSS